MKPSLRAILATLSLVAAMPVTAPAQVQQGQPVQVMLVPKGDGTYMTVLGNDTLHVITTAMMKENLKAFAERKALREEVAALESLRAPYERVVNACTSARTLDAEVIKLQTEQIRDYKDLANRLERLKNPWLTWEAGLGGNRDGPGVMAGVGVKRLRAWGVVQDVGSAWFLGYSGRVF